MINALILFPNKKYKKHLEMMINALILFPNKKYKKLEIEYNKQRLKNEKLRKIRDK
jgi:hypothetical protein